MNDTNNGFLSSDSTEWDLESTGHSKVHAKKEESVETSSPPSSTKRKSLSIITTSSNQKRRRSKENFDLMNTPNRIRGKIPSNVSPDISKTFHDDNNAKGTQNRALPMMDFTKVFDEDFLSTSLTSKSKEESDEEETSSKSHEDSDEELSSTEIPVLEDAPLFLENDAHASKKKLKCVRIDVQLYHSLASKMNHLMHTLKAHIKYRDVRVVLERFIRWERKKR